jgi:predicted esterase
MISEIIHQGQTILVAGEPLETARAAMLLLHGRGATAQSILTLTSELNQSGFAYLAPQAAGSTWYPNRFVAPIASNEPWLSSALAVVSDVLAQIGQPIPPERTILLGFSQGACLALEYAARHAQRYGGVVGLSGALIGADGEARHDRGSLKGTPVFLGCSDVDMHIPQARVHHAAEVLRTLGGEVTVRLYPNLGHTLNADEVDFVRDMMTTLVK